MNNQLQNWLVAYGEGGCWSGYPCASVVKAAIKREALDQALKLFHDHADEWTGNGGISLDAEQVIDRVEDTALFHCRLKNSAKELLILTGSIPYQRFS